MIALAFAIVVLVVTNAYTALLFVDRDVLLSYARKDARGNGAMLDAMMPILEREWKGLSQPVVMEKLNAAIADRPDATISAKEQDNEIIFGFVHFEFIGGKLGRVR